MARSVQWFHGDVTVAFSFAGVSDPGTTWSLDALIDTCTCSAYSTSSVGGWHQGLPSQVRTAEPRAFSSPCDVVPS